MKIKANKTLIYFILLEGLLILVYLATAIFFLYRVSSNPVSIIAVWGVFATLIINLVSTILSEKLRKDEVARQVDEKFEENNREFQMRKYREEGEKTKALLKGLADNFYLLDKIGGEIERGSLKKANEMLDEFVIRYKTLSYDSIDMMSEAEKDNEIIKDFSRLFYKIKPGKPLHTNEEREKWFNEKVINEPILYNKLLRDYNDKDRLQHILIATINVPIEKFSGEFKRRTGFGIKQLSRRELMQIQKFFWFDTFTTEHAIMITLEAVSENRIRELKKLEEKQLTKVDASV